MTDRELFTNTKKYIGKEVTLEGWIRNHRKQKEFGLFHFLMEHFLHKFK